MVLRTKGTLTSDEEAGPPVHTLTRELFTTKRTLEYFSEKELSLQLGGPPHHWPRILVKELIDNALDACETASIDPAIQITLAPEGFCIEDNGPGMREEVILRSLDYTVRVSDKTYYISPTRGQLGNALKCLWAAPYARNPEAAGVVRVTSQGRQHTVHISLDRIAQEPKIEHAVTSHIVKTGTTIEVELACYSPLFGADDFYKSTLNLLDGYAAFNPHASFTLTTPIATADFPATSPGWRKWRPSDPTSPHWYTPDDLAHLLAAMLHVERMGGRSRTIRDIVAEFQGLSASAKRKAVLNDTGLARVLLKDLVDGDTLKMDTVGALLAAMQRHARPVNPTTLGVLGRAHVEAYLNARRFGLIDYRKQADVTDDLPYVLEVAMGVTDDKDQTDGRCVLAGVNWAGPLSSPFRSLELWLNTAMAQRSDPLTIVVHVAIPRPTFADRSKQTLALPESISWQLESLIRQVTHRWTAAKRVALRSERADVRAEERLQRLHRQQYPSIKTAAAQVMVEAYTKASGDGRYPANAR
jgi:DNA topoisomerase VI subunit B